MMGGRGTSGKPDMMGGRGTSGKPDMVGGVPLVSLIWTIVLATFLSLFLLVSLLNLTAKK